MAYIDPLEGTEITLSHTIQSISVCNKEFEDIIRFKRESLFVLNIEKIVFAKGKIVAIVTYPNKQVGDYIGKVRASIETKVNNIDYVCMIDMMCESQKIKFEYDLETNYHTYKQNKEMMSVLKKLLYRLQEKED